MKKAIGYLRVSSKAQAGEDRFGLPSQRAMIEEYCSLHGITITEWFIDDGYSGACRDRPALNRILAGEVTNPPIQYIVVAKTDRIARDVQLYYALKFLLQQKGIEILSATEDWSEQDQLTGKILETFLALVAEIERENIKIRLMGGRNQKARGGGYAGGNIPYGYKLSNGEYMIHEAEAEVVRRVFALRRAGLSLNEITKALEKDGVERRKGGFFTRDNVRSILNNEKTYLGWYKYGNGEWKENAHDPILTGKE